jgi:hypothetical protein
MATVSMPAASTSELALETWLAEQTDKTPPALSDMRLSG